MTCQKFLRKRAGQQRCPNTRNDRASTLPSFTITPSSTAARLQRRISGVTSGAPPTVHQMILTLEKQGFISREPGQSRTIQVKLSRGQLPDLE